MIKLQMTFNPHGNITYDELYNELCENNVVDTYRLKSLRDKILQCSYYDVDLGMYATVCNNYNSSTTTIDSSAQTTYIANKSSAKLLANTEVNSCCDDSGIRAWRIVTNITSITVVDTVINYYFIPIISTKHAIHYHSYNIYKDHGEIYLSFKEPLSMIDKNCVGKYYDSMEYRTMIFSDVLTKDIEITTPLSEINTLNKLVEYVHKLSGEPCHTINNRFGPKTYREYNGRYYNTYHWVQSE